MHPILPIAYCFECIIIIVIVCIIVSSCRLMITNFETYFTPTNCRTNQETLAHKELQL